MKKIIHNEQLIAIIIPHDFSKNGIEFFTPPELSQQLAYMKRPEGYAIQPHTHNTVERYIANTLETLFIKSGKVKIDLYDNNNQFIQDIIVTAGDIILLVSGGHGFTMLEESEMIEVKQGPYMGDQDKVRF